ncbi:unnamed protein product [Closterium sp. NIES-53]
MFGLIPLSLEGSVWRSLRAPGLDVTLLRQVAASSQVSVPGQFAASCSCRVLSHQTLLWHHRLDHPSLPRLRSMHSQVLVSGLPMTLLPPPALAYPAVPSLRRGAERCFLLVVDDYTRYTTVSLLHSKADFRSCVCTLTGAKNGIAERHIGLIMEVARTSMIHAVAPHFLWPFTIQYAAHQLNLWPHVSLLETSPTLRWTGKVGDASAFRVRGALSLVRDTTASKLSPRTLRCAFLGFPTDAPLWQFKCPRSRRVLSSQDVTFDESVCFYRLHQHASHPVPLAPLFLVPVPPPHRVLLPQACLL